MFKLSECINRINQVLNYPSITYTDISHFFDQAISELNTTFKIGLPLVSQIVDDNRINISTLPNVVMLDSVPTFTPTDIPSVSDGNYPDTSKVYYNTSDNKIYRYNLSTETFIGFPKMYGIHISNSGNRTLYETLPLYMAGYVVWTPIDEKRINDFDINTYLPDDWIILFLIPYVCSKVAARDGNDSALYTEEYVQGCQQLQVSYDVPSFVTLSEVSHLPAYSKLTQETLPNIGVRVPTRAIYDVMRISDGVSRIPNAFTARGGWGI